MMLQTYKEVCSRCGRSNKYTVLDILMTRQVVCNNCGIYLQPCSLCVANTDVCQGCGISLAIALDKATENICVFETFAQPPYPDGIDASGDSDSSSFLWIVRHSTSFSITNEDLRTVLAELGWNYDTFTLNWDRQTAGVVYLKAKEMGVKMSTQFVEYSPY